MKVKQRSLYWDTIKGFLIILVVLGHCGTALGDKLISVIYIFHMPLFIIVSGYFSKKQANKSGRNKRLLGVFLLFQTMYTLLNAITSNVSVGGGINSWVRPMVYT